MPSSQRGCTTRTAKACAILSTAQTVLADNPLLNVRWEQLPHSVQQEYQIENLRQPIRIILDRASNKF